MHGFVCEVNIQAAITELAWIRNNFTNKHVNKTKYRIIELNRLVLSKCKHVIINKGINNNKNNNGGNFRMEGRQRANIKTLSNYYEI
jgi:hypothetical protein